MGGIILEFQKKAFVQIRKIKAAIKKSRCTLGKKARKTSDKLGFSETEVYDTILQLEVVRDFYHSTREYYSKTVWQDVYKIDSKGLAIYIKVKAVNDDYFVIVTSFKEDEDKVVSKIL